MFVPVGCCVAVHLCRVPTSQDNSGVLQVSSGGPCAYGGKVYARLMGRIRHPKAKPAISEPALRSPATAEGLGSSTNRTLASFIFDHVR